MDKHTPGPWRIEVIHSSDGAYTISHGVNSYGDGPAGDVGKFYGSEADARLISAAPELLDSMRKLVAVYSDIIRAEYDTDPDNSELVRHCRAVIAKAEGR